MKLVNGGAVCSVHTVHHELRFSPFRIPKEVISRGGVDEKGEEVISVKALVWEQIQVLRANKNREEVIFKRMSNKEVTEKLYTKIW